ncbi:hypothetical protein V8F33_004608 [Rhypophila sp. PSN 637]
MTEVINVMVFIAERVPRTVQVPERVEKVDISTNHQDRGFDNVPRCFEVGDCRERLESNANDCDMLVLYIEDFKHLFVSQTCSIFPAFRRVEAACRLCGDKIFIRSRCPEQCYCMVLNTTLKGDNARVWLNKGMVILCSQPGAFHVDCGDTTELSNSIQETLLHKVVDKVRSLVGFLKPGVRHGSRPAWQMAGKVPEPSRAGCVAVQCASSLSDPRDPTLSDYACFYYS